MGYHICNKQSKNHNNTTMFSLSGYYFFPFSSLFNVSNTDELDYVLCSFSVNVKCKHPDQENEDFSEKAILN